MNTRALLLGGISALLLGGTMVGCAANGGSLASAGDRSGVAAAKGAATNAGKAQTALARRDGGAAIGYAEGAVALMPQSAEYRMLLGQSYLQGAVRVRLAGVCRYARAVADQRQGGAEPRAVAGRDRRLAGGTTDAGDAGGDYPGARSWARAVAGGRYRGRDRAADRGRAVARDEREGAAESRAELRPGGPLAGGTRGRGGGHGAGGCRCAARAMGAVRAAGRRVGPGGEPARRARRGGFGAAGGAGAESGAGRTGCSGAGYGVGGSGRGCRRGSCRGRLGAGRGFFEGDVRTAAGGRPGAAGDDASPGWGAIKLAAASAPAAAYPVKPQGTGSWYVQLGAFESAGVAKDAWGRASRRFAVLAGHSPNGMAFKAKGEDFYRLSVGGFSRSAADSMCRQYRAKGGACFVRQGAGDMMAQWLRKPGVQMASR
ncbi:SPOR domain-containing protein [Sphingomonas aurantiaca]